MGIRGITAYITQNSSRYLNHLDLQDTDLVVDGVNVYCNFYRKVDKQLGQMGAQYDIFYNEIKSFFEALLLCNIRPIVIVDSIQALTKKDYIVRFRDKVETFVPGESMILPQLMRDGFLDVLRDLKIRFVQTITEADETMLAVAQALDCPILSEDGDFFLCTAKYIPWKTLNPIPKKVSGSSQYAMTCQLYSVKKLCKVFNNLDQSLLPLALIILYNKYDRGLLEAEIMQPLLDRINSASSGSASNFHHRKIEKTLNWLSKYSSLEEATDAVLDCVGGRHRSKISKDIKHLINDFGVCSPLAFTALDLPEKIVEELRESNERKMMMSKGGEEHQSESDLEFTEEKIIAMSPKWMIDDLAKGLVRGLPFELLMFSTVTLNPVNENPVYPPTGFISLPILKFAYSLICSLREHDENVLEIYSTKGKQIIREEVTVQKSSVSLKDIKSLEFTERKRIFDEGLGVDGDDSLEELPDCWRLYTAAMVFWMRQTIPPERTRHHLSSVVLMMVLGVIDDKIGFFRSKEAFLNKYGDQHREIISRSKPNDEMKGMNLLETMKAVTNEECIAAAPFFLSILNGAGVPNDWKTIVHTFTQLHSCLKNAVLLNSILGYPYESVPLHKVYNGLVFIKMFQVISKQDDTEAYLYAKLEYSPAIVAIFSKLKDIVVSMIEMK